LGPTGVMASGKGEGNRNAHGLQSNAAGEGGAQAARDEGGVGQAHRASCR
jgi:hypothetical protein